MAHVSWVVEAVQLIHLKQRFDKRFYKPVETLRWVIVVYADQTASNPLLLKKWLAGWRIAVGKLVERYWHQHCRLGHVTVSLFG